MEKRRSGRTRRRLTCELVIEGRRHPAVVLDVSPRGLFVQTRARPEPNSVVEVVLAGAHGQQEIRSEAGVARERSIPPRLKAEVPGGVGLELLDPPPAFLEQLAGVDVAAGGPETDAGTGAPPDGALRTFRIRATERGTPNARVLTVRSHGVEGARARALAQLGPRWKVADIQEI